MKNIQAAVMSNVKEETMTPEQMQMKQFHLENLMDRVAQKKVRNLTLRRTKLNNDGLNMNIYPRWTLKIRWLTLSTMT